MRTTIQHIQKELSGIYPESEIAAFTRLILDQVCGLDYTAQVMMRERELNTHCRMLISDIVERLKQFEPLQYILGETEFFGLRLRVNPSVLIPRPETEELVHWIVESAIQPDAVMDIGTGSGCLALALKKLFPAANVTGVDISEEALATARKNGESNLLDVNFLQTDILTWEERTWENYGLIVSNPPYVRESEKKLMLPNVLNHEPANALFVPNSDPLLFYRKIAGFAQRFLMKNGWLFFEINENMGVDMRRLFETEGFHAIEIKNDLSGKVRMLRCRK